MMLIRGLTIFEPLQFLLQLGGFQETIRYYVSKYRDNQIVALAYSVGCFAVLLIIYILLARKKR